LLLSCVAVFGFLSVLGQGNPLSQWLPTVNIQGNPPTANSPKEGAGSDSGGSTVRLPGEAGSSSNASRPPPVTYRGPEIVLTQGSLNYTVVVNRTSLKLGEALRINVTLSNIGSETVFVPKSYPSFKVSVYSKPVDPEVSETLRSLVWGSDYGVFNPNVVVKTPLNPGGTMSEAFEWNLTGNDGVPVAPGDYYLYASGSQSPVMGPMVISITP